MERHFFARKRAARGGVPTLKPNIATISGSLVTPSRLALTKRLSLPFLAFVGTEFAAAALI
jgi:hypothetical protein